MNVWFYNNLAHVRANYISIKYKLPILIFKDDLLTEKYNNIIRWSLFWSFFSYLKNSRFHPMFTFTIVISDKVAYIFSLHFVVLLLHRFGLLVMYPVSVQFSFTMLKSKRQGKWGHKAQVRVNHNKFLKFWL